MTDAFTSASIGPRCARFFQIASSLPGAIAPIIPQKSEPRPLGGADFSVGVYSVYVNLLFLVEPLSTQL